MCLMLGEMLNPSRDSEHFPPITFVIHAVYQPTPPRLLSPPLSAFSPLTVHVMKMMFLHASHASAVTLFVLKNKTSFKRIRSDFTSWHKIVI